MLLPLCLWWMLPFRPLCLFFSFSIHQQVLGSPPWWAPTNFWPQHKADPFTTYGYNRVHLPPQISNLFHNKAKCLELKSNFQFLTHPHLLEISWQIGPFLYPGVQHIWPCCMSDKTTSVPCPLDLSSLWPWWNNSIWSTIQLGLHKNISCYLLNGSWCTVVTLPLGFSVSLVLVHLLFFWRHSWLTNS